MALCVTINVVCAMAICVSTGLDVYTGKII